MKALVPSLLFLAVAASVDVQAATPANTLVIAQSIDDVVSFDPAQGFELTTVQSFNSLYQRLIQSDPHNPVDLKPTLASRWQAGADNRSLTFSLRPDAKFAGGNPLRAAAMGIEDGLLYFEPPPWYYPVRHSLAALLLEAGEAAEAERLYREDLARFPENGWALYGLAQSLRAQDRTEEAERVEERFRRAWDRADIQLVASRY